MTAHSPRVAVVYDEDGNVTIYADPRVTVISVCDHTPQDRLYRLTTPPIPDGMLDGSIGFAGDESVADRKARAALDELDAGTAADGLVEAVQRRIKNSGGTLQ